jgi:hypothetical protein
MDIINNPTITQGVTVIFGTNNADGSVSTVPAIVAEACAGDLANLRLQGFCEYAPGAELRRLIHHKALADQYEQTSWWLYQEENEARLADEAAAALAQSQTPTVE